jgi:hypothetical protein
MGNLLDPDLEFRDLGIDELRVMVSRSGESVLRRGRAMMKLGRGASGDAVLLQEIAEMIRATPRPSKPPPKPWRLKYAYDPVCRQRAETLMGAATGFIIDDSVSSLAAPCPHQPPRQTSRHLQHPSSRQWLTAIARCIRSLLCNSPRHNLPAAIPIPPSVVAHSYRKPRRARRSHACVRSPGFWIPANHCLRP